MVLSEVHNGAVGLGSPGQIEILVLEDVKGAVVLMVGQEVGDIVVESVPRSELQDTGAI